MVVLFAPAALQSHEKEGEGGVGERRGENNQLVLKKCPLKKIMPGLSSGKSRRLNGMATNALSLGLAPHRILN